MERKLQDLGVTESERRSGLTPRRAAPLLGVGSGDAARRLLREHSVRRLARGFYAAEEVVALRDARIESGLIRADAGLAVAEPATAGAP